MSNVIKEYQEALNTTPPLKVNIAPAFTPPAGVQDPASPPTPIIPASAFPSAPTQASPIPEQPQIQPTTSSLLEVPPTPTGDTALSYGETVSRLSAQSAQEIQKILAESGQPKPNEVQKQLLGSSNPIQIDPKLTSQNNPFKSSREPRNAAERLAFEPPVLPNGMRNAFSNPNARAALAAGISKGEYLDYIQSLRDKGAQYVGFGERDVDNGGFTNVTGQRVIETEDFTGLSADQIRQKMKDRTGFYSTQRAFNQSFLPFLGDDRGSLETLFGVLALPANLVRGVTADIVIRPAAALISGGFDVEAIKKAYEEMRPTRGGTFTGAAWHGEQFQSLAVTGEKGKPFNPFAAVRDDKNLLQVGGAFLFDLGADPLNFEVGKAFNRFRRNTVAPPPITPEVLPPVRELPPSSVVGVLPEAPRTIDVPSVVDSPITPKTPTPERVLVTPTREAPSRVYLPESTVTQDVTTSQTTVGRTVAQSDRTSFQVTERPVQETPQLGGVSDATIPQDRTSFQVVEKRAEPQLAGSYDSLVRYEPSEVVFPVPREPYSPPVIRYHGSSSPVTELKNDFFNKDNIYGNGFYTTRDRSVAETYQKKGASEGTGEGYLYQVDSSNDKLFNLDDVIPAQIRESVRLNAPNSGRLGVLYKEAERLLNGGKSYGLGGKVVTSTAELFDAVRRFSKRVEVETGEDGFAKFVDSFKPELQKSGYAGFTHEGGRLTRGKRHQVDILWSPETSVKLSQLNVPKVEPADVQLYNNVTALFNDSPQLPVVQNLLRAVVEQTPTPQTVYQNRILQEVAEYGRTGELTPNIAVLKGATPDEVRAIVQDKLEVMRDTPLVVPRLEVQPITIPKLEFAFQGKTGGRVTRGVRPSKRASARDSALDEWVVKFDNWYTSNRRPEYIRTGATGSDFEPLINAYIRKGDYLVNGEKVDAITFANISVSEDVRGKGIFSDIIKRTEERYPDKVLVIEEVNESSAALAKKNGFTVDSTNPNNWVKVPTSSGAGVDRSKVRSSVINSTNSVDLDMISDTTNGVLDSSKIESLALKLLAAGDNIETLILRKVNPIKFEVVGDNTLYLAAKRAAELDPNYTSVRSVVVKPNSEAERAFLKQQAAAKDVRKLSSDAALVSNSDNKPAYRSVMDEGYRVENKRTFSVDLENITTYRGGNYSKQAVDTLANELLDSGENLRPIVLRRKSETDFEVLRGNLEYLAAKRASEIDPNFYGVRAYIVDEVNESALLEQLDIIDGVVPVPTSKPVVVTDSAITSVADLQDAAKGIGTLGEVSQWSVKGDFATPLKDVLNAVDDLGLDALNTPALSKMVKGGIGKLSNKTVEGVASSLQKVSLETAEDIAKSIFNALWRKSTPDQKEIILGKISATRLEQLGLERVQTKITPPTTPAPLQYIQAELSYSSELERVLFRYVNGEAFEWATKARGGEGLSAYPPELLRAFSENSRQYPVLYRGLGDVGSTVSKVGDTVSDKAIQSFSTDLKEAATYSNGNIILKLEGANGLKTTAESANSLQTEVLILPDSYSVKSITDVKVRGVGGGTFTIAEIVPVVRKNTPTATLPDVTDAYHVVNNSQVPIEQLRVAMLREQGFDGRTASSMEEHPLSRSISEFGEVYDEDLIPFLKSRELSVSTPAEQKWSSKMLQQIWEVATPQQKAYIMKNVDSLEQLGLERIARSNVIDDHLPPEGVFDTPC